MAGHGAARNLPASMNCNCPNDNRRVITIRIDPSWNVDPSGNATPGQTNVNIWNATTCAIGQWNTVQDPTGYTTGYRLVLDQAGQVSQTADITIVRQTPSGGAGFASTTTTYPFIIKLAPSNGNFNNGAFSDADLCGRVAHELGHKLGIYDSDNSCNSIMNGTNPDGTRGNNSNTVTPQDVYQANRSFDPSTRGNCTVPAQDTGFRHDAEGSTGGGDPCNGDPCCIDPTNCGTGGECYTIDCYYDGNCSYWDPYTNTCYASSSPDYCTTTTCP